MGGRGSSSGSISASYSAIYNSKAVIKLAKRTANLKNEQYRIIDPDGNVLVEAKGSESQVSVTVGQKRQFMDGNISLHNHPNGGTFSSADLSDFGYGAREIVAATPEGTYVLINQKFGTKDARSGWLDMRNEIDKQFGEGVSPTTLKKQAQQNLANGKTQKELKKIADEWVRISDTKGLDEAKKWYSTVQSKYDDLVARNKIEVQAEMRRLEVKPFHDFYKKNAKKYGFEYKFIPDR